MKKTLRILFLLGVLLGAIGVSCPAEAGLFDDILKELPGIKGGALPSGPDQDTTVSGLKEALAIGTENAVKAVSKTDGYFGNAMVKILLPDKIRKIADMVAKLGFQKQVDDLTLTMNRAAEAAAPKATSLFVDAIKAMTFDDARKILQGGDTAATEYFKDKTSKHLYDAFKPVVVENMNKAGVAKAYKAMMAPAENIPLIPKESVDLDHYVTNKALEGLFVMVGEEEKKIRSDPAARVTDLLKTVFGKPE
jgi:RNA binding exosome subunit